jgi:ankyrin repeat protein
MGSPELAEFMMAHGGKPYINVKLEPGGENGWGGWTALMIAAKVRWGTRERSHQVARLLLDNGADYDIFSATAMGDAERVRELLGRGHDVLRATEGNGASLLHWAAEAGEVGCAKLYCARS